MPYCVIRQPIRRAHRFFFPVHEIRGPITRYPSNANVSIILNRLNILKKKKQIRRIIILHRSRIEYQLNTECNSA